MSNNKLFVPKGQSFSAEVGLGLPISRASSSLGGANYLPYSSQYGSMHGSFMEDNLFPQMVAQMAVETPTNGAALQRKAMMTTGRGFNLSELPESLQAALEDINDCLETANDLLEQISKDYVTFGGFSLKVSWANGGTIANIYHVPFTDVRVGKPREGKVCHYIVSNNWDRTMTTSMVSTEVYPAFNPEVFSEPIPMIDGELQVSEEHEANAEQIIYYFDKSPAASSGMRYYPVPDYFGGMDAIMTEREIHVANKALLDNGFGGKYMITFPFRANDEAEMERNDIELKEAFTGAKNNGGIISQYADDKESLPQVDKLDALEANTYIELNKETKQSIVTAHQIPAILLEYNFGGGFNNRAEELAVAYDTFQKTNIKKKQDKIVRVFRRLLTYKGFDSTVLRGLTIVPFSLIDDTVVEGETSITNTENN